MPHSWHPETYADAWTNAGLGKLLPQHAVLAVGAWLIQLIVDVTAAYALSKLRPCWATWCSA